MSRGSNGIFSVIAHWLDNNLNLQSRHLQMVQMDGTSGNAIAEKLGQMLQELGIKNKIVACVTDGGSNLKNCTDALSGIVTCDYLDIKLPYNGYCWAHVMSNCLKKALDPKLCEGIDNFDVKKLQSRLQKAITWTKKSGKGARIWEKACLKANLPPIKLYTPVKTRFGSFLIMLKQVLTYKDAIHFCYIDEENTSNTSREPTAFEWTMVKVILTFLEPILKGCIANQGKSYWSVSDATHLALRLYHFYASHSQGSTITEASHHIYNIFPGQLEWESRVSTSVANYLRKHLVCFEYPLHESGRSGHAVIALMLDPRYKSMASLLKLLTIEEGKSCIQFYDEILLKKLVRVYEHVHGGSEAQTIGDNQLNTTEENPFFGSTSGSTRTTLEIANLMKIELLRYRSETYAGADHLDEAMKWLLQKKVTYPNIFVVASAFLCITGSQIDNERSFSVAGVVTRQRRSRLTVQNLENIMQIYHNYPNDCKHIAETQQLQKAKILDKIQLEQDIVDEEFADEQLQL